MTEYSIFLINFYTFLLKIQCDYKKNVTTVIYILFGMMINIVFYIFVTLYHIEKNKENHFHFTHNRIDLYHN